MTHKQQTYRTVDALLKNNEKHLIKNVLNYLKFCEVCKKQNELCKCECCKNCDEFKLCKYKTTYFKKPLCEECSQYCPECNECNGYVDNYDWFCLHCKKCFCDYECFDRHECDDI